MALTPPFYGAYPNPKAISTITTNAAYRADNPSHIEAIRRAVVMGSDHMYEIYRWDDIEPTVGTRDFTYLDRLIANSVGGIILNIAVIDADGNRHVPASLTGTAWDAAAMTTAFNNFLTALAARFPVPTRLGLLVVGNEVDVYFATHAAELTPFGTFLSSAKAQAASLFSGIKFSCCLRFATTSSYATYAAITAVCDWQTFTYYCVNADFTVRPATDIGNDFSTMSTATGGGPFWLQEAGYPSSTLLGSSQQAQSDAVAQEFAVAAIYANANVLKGMNWTWSSDLSDAVITSLGVTPATNLFYFYQSLGVRDTNYQPKIAYNTLTSYLAGQQDLLPTGDLSTWWAIWLRTANMNQTLTAWDLTTGLRWRLASVYGTGEAGDATTAAAKFLRNRG